MKTIIDPMSRAGGRTQFKALVGGAPVTRRFAQEVGADGFSNSASGAGIAASLLLGIPSIRTPGVHLLTEPAVRALSSERPQGEGQGRRQITTRHPIAAV
jgi:hypothetical protein